MKLIGMLDSPYVRRVAISLQRLGIAFEHQPLSVLRDVAAFAQINPLIKAPSLVLDNGTVLCESGLIIDYAESLTGHSLMPLAIAARTQALRRVGLALVACEKTLQWVQETRLRPPEAQFAPWRQRVQQQLQAALQAMETELQGLDPHAWLGGPEPGQADISVAVAWGFHQHVAPIPAAEAAQHYPSLAAFAERAEQRAEFKAFPLP